MVTNDGKIVHTTQTMEGWTLHWATIVHACEPGQTTTRRLLAIDYSTNWTRYRWYTDMHVLLSPEKKCIQSTDQVTAWNKVIILRWYHSLHIVHILLSWTRPKPHWWAKLCKQEESKCLSLSFWGFCEGDLDKTARVLHDQTIFVTYPSWKMACWRR